MRPEEAKALLDSLQQGRLSVDEALLALRTLPVDDLDFARLDVHRELRQGMPEAIYAEAKEPHQTVAIARRMLYATTGPVIATRVPQATADALLEAFPEATLHAIARIVVLRAEEAEPLGLIAVVSAGTSDLPVAEEAAVVAETMGLKVERMHDAGAAGLHRILGAQRLLHHADVVVVVAGMEGALASVVGGLTPAPVVAVPTSVGYGASFEGLAALLAMLSSCAAGVVVCNIDNGFGAAMFALRLLRKRSQ
jgi:pyridinium-3,5-biscarboxylic acid mononucleotide synthase